MFPFDDEHNSAASVFSHDATNIIINAKLDFLSNFALMTIY